MAFNSAPGRAEYTAIAAQTIFPFTFKVYLDGDIKVYLTPTGQASDDVADILTITTDYTVSIDGDNGGSITLVSGATAGDSVTLIRDLDINRLIEYQNNGDLLADTLNQDQNYQTYLIADKDAENETHLRLPTSVQGVSVETPAPISEAYLRWNTAADALENDTTLPTSVQDAADSAAASASSASDSAAAALVALVSETNAKQTEWEAEAERLTAESYATEAEDTFVNLVTSNGNGTFTYTPTTDYSSLHWATKSEASSGTPITFTPVLTGNATGTGATDLIVIVTNWNSDQLLAISVDAGSYIDNNDGTITWTLGTTEQTDAMSVQATEPSMLISEIATHEVASIGAELDQTILYENATISATQFPTTIDVDLTGNTILATADDASTTSAVVEQDGGDTDFIFATPTVDNTAINYTIEAGATNTSATVSGLPLPDGDIVLLNDGASITLTEFNTTSHVTNLLNDVTDLTNTTNTSSLTVGNTVATDIMYSPDGLSFYYSDASSTAINTIRQYNMSVAFDVSTATSFGVTGNLGVLNINGIAFNNDGTKVYTANATTDDVREYSLSTAYDITTVNITAVNVLSIIAKEPAAIQALAFNTDGTKMYIAGYSGSIHEYDLSTAYDISSAVFLQSKAFSAAGLLTFTFVFNNEGSLLFMSETVDDTIRQYSLSTPFDVSTMVYDSLATTSFGVGIKIDISSDGKYISYTKSLVSTAFQLEVPFTLNTNYMNTIDLTSASLTSAPTTITKDTASISTSIVATGAGDNFEARTAQSHTGNIATSPVTITDVFNTDTRTGRDIKHKVELADSGDEVTRISTVVQKIG